jgi:hypothetical protein
LVSASLLLINFVTTGLYPQKMPPGIMKYAQSEPTRFEIISLEQTSTRLISIMTTKCHAIAAQ